MKIDLADMTERILNSGIFKVPDYGRPSEPTYSEEYEIDPVLVEDCQQALIHAKALFKILQKIRGYEPAIFHGGYELDGIWGNAGDIVEKLEGIE